MKHVLLREIAYYELKHKSRSMIAVPVTRQQLYAVQGGLPHYFTLRPPQDFASRDQLFILGLHTRDTTREIKASVVADFTMTVRETHSCGYLQKLGFDERSILYDTPLPVLGVRGKDLGPTWNEMAEMWICYGDSPAEQEHQLDLWRKTGYDYPV